MKNKNWRLKHGFYGTRLYEIWRGMKKRCFLKTHTHFKNYGGRGITVCNEWRDNAMCFFNWAMSNGYRDDLTLDRIDNDGNYEPSNCRWVTWKEQGNNKRTTKLITYKNETHCISDWSKILGINSQTISERLKRGWSVERSLSTPKIVKTLKEFKNA